MQLITREGPPSKPSFSDGEGALLARLWGLWEKSSLRSVCVCQVHAK